MAPLQALRNRLQGCGGTPWIHEEKLTDPVMDAFHAERGVGMLCMSNQRMKFDPLKHSLAHKECSIRLPWRESSLPIP